MCAFLQKFSLSNLGVCAIIAETSVSLTVETQKVFGLCLLIWSAINATKSIQLTCYLVGCWWGIPI